MTELMNSNSLDIEIVRVSDLPTVDLDGEIGLMNINKGKYYAMDPVGSHIWQLLDTPKNINGLVELLLKDYDIPKETCMEHVIEFINDLYNAGLICIENR